MFRRYPLLKVAAIADILSLAVFFLQGGFGGGHAALDGVVAILGFPAIFTLDWLPLPKWMVHYDVLVIILVPAVMNAVLICLCYEFVRRVRRSRSSS